MRREPIFGDVQLGQQEVGAVSHTEDLGGGKRRRSVQLALRIDRLRIAVEPENLDALIEGLIDARDWAKGRG